MRYPLRYQVFVPMSLTMLATVIAICVLTGWLATRRAYRQVQYDLDRIADTLQASAFPLNNATLEKMRGLSGAEFVLLRAGRTVASSRDWPQPVEQVLGAANSPAPAGLGRSVMLGGEAYFERQVAITASASNEAGMSLFALYPETAWRAARREAIFPSFVAGLAGILATAVVAVMVSRRVTQPIRVVAERMERLASGVFEQSPTPARNDEVRDLVVTANWLAHELSQLHQAIRRGERLTLLGRLSGGLAHQLRNGVTGARLAMQLHRRACDVDEESLQTALRQLDLVEEQLCGFLSLGKQQLCRTSDCDLRQLAKDVQALIQPNCAHRQVILQLELPNEPLVVCGDLAQMRQLLLNLTINALEAVEACAHRIVTIRLERLAQSARVLVCDTGPGVATAVEADLFEPFASSKPEGIGLGLAVASQIARSHGGSLTYRRQNGETCFEWHVPLAAPAARSAQEAELTAAAKG
ncbi:MAG: HAMP domain-containing histidine kinase [Pirellulales bacterium]|nr:HAMP domain-containing histidine kinase [Pirellulales bacterium]